METSLVIARVNQIWAAMHYHYWLFVRNALLMLVSKIFEMLLKSMHTFIKACFRNV